MLIVGTGASGGAPPPFTPTSIAGLFWWLRSDLGVTLAGANVTQWNDQSGTGDANRNVSAPGGSQPTFTAMNAAFNNQPSIDFNGNVPQKLSMGGLWSVGAIAQPYDLFVIGLDTGGGLATYLGHLAADNIPVAGHLAGAFGSSVGVNFVGTTPDNGQAAIINIHANDPTSQLRVSAYSAEKTGNAALGTLPGLSLGVANVSQQPLTGSICEVLGYTNLSPANRSKIITYLAARYAIV